MTSRNSIITLISLLLTMSLWAFQPMTSIGQDNPSIGDGDTKTSVGQTLHITKDATNSYTISSGTSYIGSFDTTYSVVGDVGSMDESKDLVISTIIQDFGTSPTIGYVNNTGASSSSQEDPNQLTLPNPFATKQAIDEKIRSEIAASIENAVTSDLQHGEIKCLFGSSLDDFVCRFHGLVG